MQQYVIDPFCMPEARRLSYVKDHQVHRQASDYNLLKAMLGDSRRKKDIASVIGGGRLLILQSTYIGGIR